MQNNAFPPGSVRSMNASSLKTARSVVPTQTKQSSSKLHSRGIKWCTFTFWWGIPLKVNCCYCSVCWWVRVKINKLLLILYPCQFASIMQGGNSKGLFSFTGARSLKSSGPPSVKTAKVVAVAQSKLTFIKPVPTGIWWQSIVKGVLWCVKSCFVYLKT